jgi:hypothetical protein
MLEALDPEISQLYRVSEMGGCHFGDRQDENPYRMNIVLHHIIGS